MKTRVLAKTSGEGNDWVGEAYQQEGVFCSAVGASEAAALQRLRAKVERALATHGRAWLQQWSGSPNAPSCPEGAIKLPIDLWVCKVVNQTCPLQAQVFLDEPDRFFQHCLAPPERKRHIFETVSNGEYGGFHHVAGRYLCVSCEQEGKKISFRYHYPWELTCVEAYCPFVVERDWPKVRSKMKAKGWGLSNLTTALCAMHCKSLAQELDPAIAARLHVLDFDITR
jgi:hypothetical protein